MNKLVKTVPINDLYSEFVIALNGILKLTPRELELLITLIDIDTTYVPTEDDRKNVVSTVNRKRLIEKLGVTPDNLSRYIKTLKEKGILIEGPADDEVKVNTALIPTIIKDRVQITIILRIDDSKKTKEG